VNHGVQPLSSHDACACGGLIRFEIRDLVDGGLLGIAPSLEAAELLASRMGWRNYACVPNG
jgi:hypothetical protein